MPGGFPAPAVLAVRPSRVDDPDAVMAGFQASRSGNVWSVYWSPGQKRQPSNPLDVRLVAPDLASYLVQATRILRRAPITFVAEQGRFNYYKGTGPSFV